MGKSKAGRKRKAGARFPGGKLRQAWDYGCEGVQRRQASNSLSAVNENGERKTVTDQSYDAIGRAWAAGLLVVEGKDPTALRDAGRGLAALYWRWYGLDTGFGQTTLARYLPAGGKGMDDIERDRRLEDALNDRLARIRSPGHNVRRAVESLCIDLHLDEGPAWLERLIFATRHGQAPSMSDSGTMNLALRGLAMIV